MFPSKLDVFFVFGARLLLPVCARTWDRLQELDSLPGPKSLKKNCFSLPSSCQLSGAPPIGVGLQELLPDPCRDFEMAWACVCIVLAAVSPVCHCPILAHKLANTQK